MNAGVFGSNLLGKLALSSSVSNKISDYQLLMTSDFVAELKKDISAAETRVCIQLMTFDGDASGLEIADLLIRTAGRGGERQDSIR